MKIKLLLGIFTAVSICTLMYEYLAVGELVCSTYSCASKVDNVLLGVLILSILNIIVLIVIRLFAKNSFIAWWKFAKFGIPSVLIIGTYIGLELHHAPAGEMQGVLDGPVLVFVYLIFIIVSIVQIIRGYRQ